jgi:hypothetical protein
MEAASALTRTCLTSVSAYIRNVEDGSGTGSTTTGGGQPALKRRMKRRPPDRPPPDLNKISRRAAQVTPNNEEIAYVRVIRVRPTTLRRRRPSPRVMEAIPFSKVRRDDVGLSDGCSSTRAQKPELLRPEMLFQGKGPLSSNRCESTRRLEAQSRPGAEGPQGLSLGPVWLALLPFADGGPRMRARIPGRSYL